MTARHPLFVANGSAGVTQPKDARLAQAALWSTTGAGPLDATAGIVYGPGSPCKVTGSSSGPNMQYVIAAGQLVTARGTATDGLMLWANDAPLTVDSGSPAPASGKRYDLVYALARNANDGFGDADSDTMFGVTVGTAASSPTKPTASVPAGALILAEVLVGTSIANAAAATITQVAPYQALRGSPLPVASAAVRDALITSPYTGQVIYRLDEGLMQAYDGAAWKWVTAPAPTWTALSTLYNGGITDFGTGFEAGSYTKNDQGIVTLRGSMKNTGVLSNGYVMFTLPAGFRPVNSHIFPIYTSLNAVQAVKILNTGDVSAVFTSGQAANGAVVLDGVSFATN